MAGFAIYGWMLDLPELNDAMPLLERRWVLISLI